MLAEREAVVLEVEELAIHGLPYVDVTLGFDDRTTDRARLGPEAIPDGLRAGERVLVTRAVNIVISLRRP